MHIDLFGRELKVGDYIAYSAVDGRSATMRVGKIEALKKREGRYAADQTYTVFCRSWSNYRNSSSWYKTSTGAPTGRQKNVTLSFVDRLIYVSPEMIPEHIKKELEGEIGTW